MTVSNTSPLVENKTGNGVWTTIAVTPGQILQNSDGTHAIKVIKTTIADGTTVTLTETTDYTVALDGTSPSTGTITIVAGAPSSSYRFTVLSNLTPKQEVNLQNGTIVDMEDIESALDRLTLYAHKQDEKLERAVVLSEDTLTRDLTIDSLDSQAGKVLRVNADEDGFDYVDVTEGISQATFDINSLTAIDTVVTATDKLPIYDVSTGLTKYVVPDDLGITSSEPSWLMLTNDYTLTSTTNEQKAFNDPTNGTLTLPTGVYTYECFLLLFSMSSTAGSMAFDPIGAGTATGDRFGQFFIGSDNNTPETGVTVSGTYTVTQQSSNPVLNSGTGTKLWLQSKGMFRVSVGGTIIPSISLTTAAAAIVKAGSWFRLTRDGDSTVTYNGSWS